MYEVYEVENVFLENGLGSHAALYGKGILELPSSSLAEEFKCATARLEMAPTVRGPSGEIVSTYS